VGLVSFSALISEFTQLLNRTLAGIDCRSNYPHRCGNPKKVTALKSRDAQALIRAQNNHREHAVQALTTVISR